MNAYFTAAPWQSTLRPFLGFRYPLWQQPVHAADGRFHHRSPGSSHIFMVNKFLDRILPRADRAGINCFAPSRWNFSSRFSIGQEYNIVQY